MNLDICAGCRTGWVRSVTSSARAVSYTHLAAKAACEKMGVEYVAKTNIPEGQECYDAACELADAGCDFIFADSFGHEDYVIEAAKEYPEVQMCIRDRPHDPVRNLHRYRHLLRSWSALHHLR